MNEFIYTNNSLLTKLLELIAAVTGLILFKKYKETNVRYFIYFLWYVFIIELIGGYTVYVHKFEMLSHIKEYLSNTWARRNNWFYCIFWTLGSAIFYAFYFRKMLGNNKFKSFIKVIAYSFIIYSIIAIVNNWDDFFVTNIKGISVFSTIVISCSILLYLVEVLKSDKILKFYKTMATIVGLSVLLWTVITTPLAFFAKYFNQQDWSFVYLRINIMFFANVFLYITFTVGLIVSKPELKT